jgi:hypothetical protein
MQPGDAYRRFEYVRCDTAVYLPYSSRPHLPSGLSGPGRRRRHDKHFGTITGLGSVFFVELSTPIIHEKNGFTPNEIVELNPSKSAAGRPAYAGVRAQAAGPYA